MERVSFRPCGAETRAVELATTTSRRQPWRFYGAWAVRNEFIEKAIRFYSGYLDAESADAYLPRVLADVLEGKLNAFGKRMGHLLFKLSVDQNLMGNILAADIEIDPDQLRKARVRCVKEVKETNGEISFEDTVRYQKGAE